MAILMSDWITENLRISIENQYRILYSLLIVIVFIILRYYWFRIRTNRWRPLDNGGWRCGCFGSEYRLGAKV